MGLLWLVLRCWRHYRVGKEAGVQMLITEMTPPSQIPNIKIHQQGRVALPPFRVI